MKIIKCIFPEICDTVKALTHNDTCAPATVTAPVEANLNLYAT